MDCPRCKARLVPVEIPEHDSKVPICAGCNGAFFGREQAYAVMAMGMEKLAGSALAPILKEEFLARDSEESADCPVCQETMLRSCFSESCKVEVDVCTEHGLWLDDGELGAILKALQ